MFLFWVIELEIFFRPARFHNLPRIRCGNRFVNDDRRSRAALRSDLVFVSPATVIRHRFPLEHFLVELRRIVRIGNGRIVDQHQDRFPANVDAFVIVPAVFGATTP